MASNFSLQLSLSNLTMRSWEYREWSLTKEALDCSTNSPCQHFRKCIGNSMENMHTDVWVFSFKDCYTVDHSFVSCYCLELLWIRKDILFLTTIVLNYHLIPFSQAWCLRFGRSPRERLIQLILFFCHFVLLQLYTHYVGNFDKATETLASWIKKSPTMAAVIEEIQVRYATKFSIECRK